MPVSPVGEAPKSPGMAVARGCPPPPSNVDPRRQRAQPSSPSQTQGRRTKSTEYGVRSQGVTTEHQVESVAVPRSTARTLTTLCLHATRQASPSAKAARGVCCEGRRRALGLKGTSDRVKRWLFWTVAGPCRLHGSSVLAGCMGAATDVTLAHAAALRCPPKKGTDQTVGAAWLT